MPPKLEYRAPVNADMEQAAEHFTGAPKWYAKHARGIINEASRLAQADYQKFGTISEVTKKKIEELTNPKTSKHATLSMSVTGQSQPIKFTPAELLEARRNLNFASNLYAITTGNENITKQDILDFQKRIDTKYPKLNELVSSSKYKTLKDQETIQQKKRDQKLLDKQEKEILNKKEIERLKQEIESTKKKLNNVGDPNKEITDEELGDLYLNKDVFRSIMTKHNYPLTREGAQKFISDYSTENNKRFDRSVISVFDRDKIKQYLPPNLQGQDLKYNLHDPNKAIARYHRAINQKRYKDAIESYENKIKRLNDFSYPSVKNYPSVEQRAGMEREIRNLMLEGARNAPLNEKHKQAERLLQYQLDDDTLDSGKGLLNKAANQDISASISPYIQEIKNPNDKKIDNYLNQYQKNVIKDVRKEAQEKFLEDIFPQIQGAFAKTGTFHSGARKAAITKAEQKTRESLNREINKMLHQSYRDAVNDVQVEKDRNLQAAQIVGNATKSQQENLRSTADAYRLNAAQRKNLTHMDVGALNQMAKTQQEQQQNDLNLRMAEHQAEVNYPWQQLEKEAAIFRGNPPPNQQVFTSSQMGQPQPPNVYNTGAGLIQQMTGLNKAQEVPFAKGGRVQNNFAKGGSLENVLNNLGAPNQQNEQEIGQEIRSNYSNPLANYFMAAGSHQLSNPTGDPLRNYGEASLIGLNEMNAAKAHNLQARTQAANLYNKINESRIQQQQVLAQYATKKAEQEETARYHNAHLDFLKQQHNDMYNLKLSQNAVKGKADELPKLDIANRKLLLDANANLSDYYEKKKKIANLRKLNKKLTTGTFFLQPEIVSNPYFQSILTGNNFADLAEFHKGNKDLANAALSKVAGSRGGIGMLEFEEKTNPNAALDRAANEKIYDDMEKNLDHKYANQLYLVDNYVINKKLPIVSLLELNKMQRTENSNSILPENSNSILPENSNPILQKAKELGVLDEYIIHD